ncbi:hypothetical protein BGZ46_001453 [Entomortierella lignicola]|nr:hypothetical protein BGZ46_001453 [Entomortierella lignicola]
MDGSPTSTFGLQLPAFMNTVDDYLEGFLRILGGGEPLAKVIRVGSDYSAFARSITTAATATTAAVATSTGVASATPLDSVTDAISAVLLSAAGTAV